VILKRECRLAACSRWPNSEANWRGVLDEAERSELTVLLVDFLTKLIGEELMNWGWLGEVRQGDCDAIKTFDDNPN